MLSKQQSGKDQNNLSPPFTLFTAAVTALLHCSALHALIKIAFIRISIDHVIKMVKPMNEKVNDFSCILYLDWIAPGL